MKGWEEVSAKSVGSKLMGHKKPPQKKSISPNSTFFSRWLYIWLPGGKPLLQV